MTTPTVSIVRGQCPVCGVRALVLDIDGDLSCTADGCPDPSAISDLVVDHMGPEHTVVIGEGSFRIQHPLRERLDGFMFECDVHRFLEQSDGPPYRPGVYRVTQIRDDASIATWSWVRLGDAY